MKKIILFVMCFCVEFADAETILLVCKSPKGLALRMDAKAKKEKFKKDGFSSAVVTVIYNKGKIGFSWVQNSAPWNDSEFTTLKTVSANSNMATGFHTTPNTLEGIRIHLKNKTAIYYKHVAPTVDGFGTDGIYKMKCKDKSSEIKSLKNPPSWNV